MKLQSFLANSIEGYIRYRKISGRTSYSYVKNVVLFDHFCAREYPGHTELTQEIADRWCKQRETESTNSCVSRIYPVLDLFKYLKKTRKDPYNSSASTEVITKNLYTSRLHA